MKFNCAKLSPELPCVSAGGRAIQIETSEEREHRWKRKRDIYKLRTLEATKGTEINSRLRYIVEIVEITREDIYVTAKETDSEREWRSKSLSTVSGIPRCTVFTFYPAQTRLGEIL